MTNKLLEKAPKSKGRKAALADLHELAESLNKEVWVQRWGRKYFVKREPNPRFVPGSDNPKEREFIHELAWSG